MTDFWDKAVCSIAEVEAVRTSVTSVCINETTRRYVPESCHLHTRHREELKSYIYTQVSQSTFPTGCPTKIIYAFPSPPMRAT
jgi:hypothetical protein